MLAYRWPAGEPRGGSGLSVPKQPREREITEAYQSKDKFRRPKYGNHVNSITTYNHTCIAIAILHLFIIL